MLLSKAPRRLFKYFTADRASLLTTAFLRYSPLGAFNDPFEGRPEITGLVERADFDRMVDDALESESNQAYEQLPPTSHGV
jgi:hypothetical protein